MRFFRGLGPGPFERSDGDDAVVAVAEPEVAVVVVVAVPDPLEFEPAASADIEDAAAFQFDAECPSSFRLVARRRLSRFRVDDHIDRRSLCSASTLSMLRAY